MSSIPFRQVHLDFHNTEKIGEIGVDFEPEAFADTLKKAHVESVNCFAKCVHGMLYYRTEHPAQHPGLTIDLLREQIKACHEAGIRAPVYLCAGWDEYAARNHAEWLERNVEGKPYGAGPLEAPRTPFRKLCFNTPYAGYFLDQLKDVMDKLAEMIDGFFIDIVWQDPCCCNFCLQSMEESGLDALMESDRRIFASKVLTRFKQSVSDTVKQCGGTLFFNSGHIGPCLRGSLTQYTHLEIESLPTDVGASWGYAYLPITARYARTLGKEFIGMNGRFHLGWGDFGGYKNMAALEYECFQSIVLGGKCIVGDQLHPRGALEKPVYDRIGQVFSRIRENEPWCKGGRPVPEIAVVHPEAVKEESYVCNITAMPLSGALVGAYRMLEEEHFQFDVIDGDAPLEHYKAIILPDVITLDDAFAGKLAEYAENGGKIILSYKSGLNRTCDAFTLPGMGVRYLSELEYSPDYMKLSSEIGHGIDDLKYVMYDRGLKAEMTDGARALAEVWNPYFNRDFRHYTSHFQAPADAKSPYPAVTINQTGNMVYFAHPVFSMYDEYGSWVYKKTVANCLDMLIRERLVYTDAPTTAQVHFFRQKDAGRYVLHFLHYIPQPRTRTVCTFEDVIPLHDISVRIRLPENIERVYCVSSGRKLAFEYESGYIKTAVPEIRGHEIVVFE